jgi:hypothetical protein
VASGQKAVLRSRLSPTKTIKYSRAMITFKSGDG